MVIVFLAILLGLILLNIGIAAILLKLGIHWIKADDRSYRTAFTTIALATIVSYGIIAALFYFDMAGASILEATLLFLLPIAAHVIFVQFFYGTSALRSAQALLPILLAPLLYVPFMFLVFNPFIGQTFVVPTNSMAPTVLGTHLENTCSTCGAAETIAVSPPQPDGTHCICDNFHTRWEKDARGKKVSGDRIFVTRFLNPQRWDIAAFQVPFDPQETYIKRVVGLPGETIHIEDGYVFADGEKLTPPENLQGLTYTTSIGGFVAISGTKDNPAVLGPDEYFVLGDNTERASDSRFWSEGVDGRGPYAVPESHLLGVATTIYWPPKRWKNLK